MNPYIISFPVHGQQDEGFLAVAEMEKTIPFNIQRVFWTYHTPIKVSRGRHTHHETEMVLIALQGKITIETINRKGEENTFVLDRPQQGLYLPALCWHEIFYTEDALQLVLASTLFSDEDYIKSLGDFYKIINQK